MLNALEAAFPNLRGSDYRISSPPTGDYNCIAFAADDTNNWWWPREDVQMYWPEEVPREETIEAFIAAFRTLNYAICEDGMLEQGFEKVALYARPDGTPTHMAKQLASGQWTSKCGPSVDIQHQTLEALTGDKYGIVVRFLRRSIP